MNVLQNAKYTANGIHPRFNRDVVSETPPQDPYSQFRVHVNPSQPEVSRTASFELQFVGLMTYFYL
jgi:hypothetical protein